MSLQTTGTLVTPGTSWSSVLLTCPLPGIGPSPTTPLGLRPSPSALTSVPLIPRIAVLRNTGVLSPETTAGLGSQSLPSNTSTGPQTSASGFSLSPATQPFPQKLVEKVRSGLFVEMRELAADNISLMQQLEGFSAQCTVPGLPGALKPRLREPTSLASWMYCFLGFLGIRATDLKMREGLAYARLIIREAQLYGGSGWLDYDRLFRQQAAIEPSLLWDTIHPGIQAATLGQSGRSNNSQFCTLCREPDHSADRCALTYLQQPSSCLPSGGTIWQGHEEQMRRPTSRTESRQRICISWNQGQCIYPGSDTSVQPVKTVTWQRTARTHVLLRITNGPQNTSAP